MLANEQQLVLGSLEPLSSHSSVYLPCVVEAPCAIRTPSTTTVGGEDAKMSRRGFDTEGSSGDVDSPMAFVKLLRTEWKLAGTLAKGGRGEGGGGGYTGVFKSLKTLCARECEFPSKCFGDTTSRSCDLFIP